MKKSKIIFLLIFLIAAVAVLYFAYGVVKNRYFGPGKNNTGTNNSATQNQAGDQTSTQSVGESSSAPEEGTSDIGTAPPENGKPNVQNSDCDNNCANFKDNADNLKYCQEVCGDRPATVKDSAKQCENLTGLDQDGCWRDLAISKKDFSFCDKISDAKLKRACRNRVTEEVLN